MEIKKIFVVGGGLMGCRIAQVSAQAGVATPEDIDKGMRLGFGRPMGPFETNDLTGLDVSLNAALNIYNETKDPKFWPPALMFRKVKAGHLGRKTGRGWYEYTPDGKKKS